jgi:hypothetical protein
MTARRSGPISAHSGKQHSDTSEREGVLMKVSIAAALLALTFTRCAAADVSTG